MRQHIEELDAAHADPSVPHLYVNGFTIGLGSTDISILLKINNRPALVLNVPYTLGKTLAEKLGGLIVTYEDITKGKVPTTDQINEILLLAGDEEE